MRNGYQTDKDRKLGMKKYICFNADSEINHKANTLDFNRERVLSHLKALIRGYGSTTENIVIDFVKNTYSNLVEHKSFQDAWNKLDVDQKDMVVGFRTLTDKYHISATSGDFVSSFYCNLVRDRFRELESEEIENSSMNDHYDDLPIDIQLEIAKKAEHEIREEVGEHNAVPAFSVKEYEID